MPTYIGENEIIDRYLGDKNLEAAYIGDKKVYDPYTEITGYLPMIFKSRAAVALKNYRIRGTPEGAGVETENLVTEIIQNVTISSTGTLVSSSILNASIAPITAGKTYTLLRDYTNSSLFYAFFTELPAKGSTSYDGNRETSSQLSVTITAPITGYVVLLNKENKSTVAEGNTAIPPGYKLPLTVKGEKTENLAPPLSEWGNGYVSSGGPIAAATEAGKERYSPVISVEPNATYQWAYEAGQFPTGMYGAWFGFGWYDRDGNFISRTDGNAEVVSAVVAPANAKYVILSFDTYGEGYNTVFIKSSTHPDHYIPHRYTSDIPIYIGGSKLGENEFVDYESGKVWKRKSVHEDTITIDGIEWDILGYDHDEVYKEDGTKAKHTVTIQTRNTLQSVPFDSREALFAFPEGLSAGAYSFTIADHSWVSSDIGKTITFTLGRAIPAGGQLMVNQAYNASFTTGTVSSFASPSATAPIETVSMAEGAAGSSLGNIGGAAVGNTNSCQRALRGSNRWSTSDLRQLLNSDAAAGSVWAPQTIFDRPPSWAESTDGFLHGADPDFISVLGNTKKRNALNTSSDGGGYEDTFGKVFLLSRSEVYAGLENNIDEGEPYDYYKDFSELSSPGTTADANRIKQAGGQSRAWWTRSIADGSGVFDRSVTDSGVVTTYAAMTPIRFAPACCIILDDIAADPWLQAHFLKPTDPPAPLPPIPTYKGENTLSSTETLGEVTIKGRISPSRWPLTNLIFHRYDEFYPELEGANRIAVSETFHLDAGAYILHQEVITSPEPVVVIQTEGFTGGIFPSFDGYWHVDTPGLYRFQVNKSNVLDPWNAAELETLGRTSTINKD